jgi:hypothetical protein
MNLSATACNAIIPSYDGSTSAKECRDVQRFESLDAGIFSDNDVPIVRGKFLATGNTCSVTVKDTARVFKVCCVVANVGTWCRKVNGCIDTNLNGSMGSAGYRCASSSSDFAGSVKTLS